MVEDTRIVSEANVAYVAEKLNNTILSEPENSTEGYIVSSDPKKPAKMKFVSKIFGLESNGSLDDRIVNVGLLKYILQECGLIIPDGYTKLQYIQSQAVSASSGSYIDLGYTPTSNVKMLIDFQYLNDRNNGYCAIFGSRRSSQNDTRSLCLWYYRANGFTYAYNSRHSAKTSTLFTERMSVEINKNICKFNDGTTISNPESSFTCNQDLYLFCTNTGGSAATNSNLRIFSFKLDDGNVHLNLVPCKRNSDNVIGMIDTNTKTFYTNQDNSHPFIAGPEIN